MSEAAQMLKQKVGELEAALAEVQGEMTRAGPAQHGPHGRLSGRVTEARQWLEAHRSQPEPGGEEAAARAAQAEKLLHGLRMGRGEL